MKNHFHITFFGVKREAVPIELMAMASSSTFIDYQDEKFMEPLDPVPDVIVCFSANEEEIPNAEIAQTLRMNAPLGIIFFVTYEKSDFNKKILIKNGFSQTFLLPWEMKDLIGSMKNESVYSSMPELRNYTPVKIVDFIPGTILDFSVKAFLPLNNLLIPFSTAGSPITAEKMSKLEEHSFNILFIANEDLEKFRTYTAQTLKGLLKPGTMNETDRHGKLKKCVRDLISDIFVEDINENTFSKSQDLLKEVKEVIQLLIGDKELDYFKKIKIIANQESSFYQHLSNVSAYSGIFALMLGHDNPEDLALAGILHDLGKVNLPAEYAELDESTLSPHALLAFQNHPAFTLDVVRLKRIPLPDKVITAILQHHEAMNGSGYPEGLKGQRISLEGRILAIANSFDKLTTMKRGERLKTPREALQMLFALNSGDPNNMILDVQLLKNLIEFI